MFGIDDPSAVAVLPTPEAAGTVGFWTEGNPGTGTPATLMRASFFNGLQQELLNVLSAANITPNKTTYNQLLSAILKIGGGSSRVRGLGGANNSGTPNTQFDFSAAAVDFRDPAGGTTPSVTNVAAITNNILTAGPVANGRDQVGAFTVSTWVHFYFIFNPTTSTLATTSSATAPPTGPALPTGYTAWAYIGAVFLNAGPALSQGYFRGAWFTYASGVTTVNAGGATTRTAVSLTSAIPPNALEFKLYASNLGISAGTGGNYGVTCNFEVVAASIAYQFGLQGIAPSAGNAMFASGGSNIFPNVAQNYNYYVVISTGAGPTTTHVLTGYKTPNGGE